jgi:hypothetical protein
VKAVTSPTSTGIFGEIAHNPGFTLTEDGSLVLSDF